MIFEVQGCYQLFYNWESCDLSLETSSELQKGTNFNRLRTETVTPVKQSLRTHLHVCYYNYKLLPSYARIEATGRSDCGCDWKNLTLFATVSGSLSSGLRIFSMLPRMPELGNLGMQRCHAWT